MAKGIPESFEGFITLDGEPIPVEDADRIFSIITRRTESKDDIIQMLWGFAQECSDSGHFGSACAYIDKVLSLVDAPSEKAGCLLAMGQAREMSGDYMAALEIYSRAFELPQEKNETWYFLNNNLAYCLNQERLHKQAEKHCRAAIKINPKHHNAHKNLGIAQQGQGHYANAAQSFIRATGLCPTDSRALGLLENLLAIHGEILEENPDLPAQRHRCHEKVQSAKGKLRLQ